MPAVVTTSALGLQLGLLAKPSGEALTISRESLLAKGIQKPGLLSITYLNGETSTVIYTGGSLQAPLLAYSSGAFVGVQEVETRVVWTSIKQDEFYSQIASISGILGGMLGAQFSQELVKTLLLSGLTDSQVLDIANELVRSVEWLKTLSANKRIEAIKKITDYVKKGDTAEEARKKLQKEAEEFVKNVELEISSFCNSISYTTLANEVDDLSRHILKTLGPDAARWLLNLLADNYLKDKRSYGDAYANERLRKIIEKGLEYPRSLEYGCSLTSSIVEGLMMTGKAAEELDRIVKGLEGWRTEYLLTDKEIKGMTSDSTWHGELAKRRAKQAIMETGEILGRRIKVDSVLEEVWVGSRRVDLVFEKEDGKLIVVEVKSTIEPQRVWYMYQKAIESLKVDPGYIELIKKYGLKKGETKINKEVEAYIAFVSSFDKEKRMWFIEMIMEVS